MSRLIDADELIKAIKNHKTNVGSESGFANEIYALAHEHIIDVITIQLTAFDTEKVVERLEEEKNKRLMFEIQSKEECEKQYFNGTRNGFADAIDIVKKGGVE